MQFLGFQIKRFIQSTGEFVNFLSTKLCSDMVHRPQVTYCTRCCLNGHYLNIELAYCCLTSMIWQ